MFLESERPLPLTPTYDMLPMLYRPSATGEIIPRDLQLPSPPPAYHAAWAAAAPLALDFWQRLAHEPTLSETFRGIATTNHGLVAAFVDQHRLAAVASHTP